MSKVFFVYSDNAVRYDTNTEQIDQTAKPLREIWPSLPLEWSSCDAVLNYGRGMIYFFKGKKFVRYNILSNSVDWGEDDKGQPGFHIAKYLRGFPSHWPKIDAAVNYGNGRIYLFYQDEYVRYDVYEDRIDQEVRNTHSNWRGVPEDWEKFDAALNYGNGKIYFFLNGLQVRYDIDAEQVDQSPTFIADSWNGVSPSAIQVTAAFPIDIEAEKMGFMLEKDLAYSAPGYAYCIYEGARCVKFGSGGISRRSKTSGCDVVDSFSLRTQFDIASMTKTYTGALATLILDEQQISFDSKIKGYLPSSWDIPEDSPVNDITFRHLLTHTSGLIREEGTGNYRDLKALFLNPTNFDSALIGRGNYKNANFAILRILLPIAAKTVQLRARVRDSLNGPLTARAFLDLMKQKVFAPAGVTNIGAKFTLDNRCSFFRRFYNNDPGYSDDTHRETDDSLSCGAGGLKMSIMQLGRLINAVAMTTKILTERQRKLMFDGGFGCSSDIGHRILATHNGGVSFSTGDQAPVGMGGSQFVFNNNVQCVVFANATGVNHEAFVKNAFHGAYANKTSFGGFRQPFTPR